MCADIDRLKNDRVAIACRTCRRRKVRCTGGHPCMHCLRLAKECTYPPQHRRRKTTVNPQNTSLTGDCDAIVEELARGSDDATCPASPKIFEQSRHHLPTTVAQGITSIGRSDPVIGTTTEFSKATLSTGKLTELGVQPQQDHFRTIVNVEKFIDPSPIGFSISADSPSTPGRSQIGDEAKWKGQDASTWLSTCSEAGVSWVCKATGGRTFAKSVERFIRSMDQLLSPGAGLVLDMRGAEPPEALAWEYVNAFFDNCWEARLGFVSRSDFEAQLQAHFYNETPWCNDHATYALRNVVFAAGFRSLQAQSGTVSYTTAQKDAWQGCFSNALSVLAGLLLSPSQLSAVQALALMACYVESLGRPGFQRILCDNAVRAAVTQGLHREHKQLINTSLDESVKNAWLWWSLYVLEKHIAFVSGTPSVIDDSTITTPIPSEVSMDSNIDMQYLTLALRHTKICSRITRELMSTQARRLSVDALRKTVKEFDQQIKDFLRDLPSRFQIGTLAKLSTDGQRIPHPNQALYLHFSIYGSLLAVHSQFFYPWISSRLVDHDPENLIATQLKASSNIVAEAARKILVALRTLTTDAATPGWLAFSYPIYAHLSLLVYVLRNPTASTTRADLGLLDVCAGHFGYIDFITASAVSISLPRESVNLAAKVVKAAEKRQDEDRAADLDRITDSTRGYIPGKP